MWSLGWYISIYMHDICTYSTSKCIRNPLRNNLQGYIHTSDFKFQDINLQKWPKTPKICMKKKFHPEKRFISNFDVLKHPDLFLTKKYFLEIFFFRLWTTLLSKKKNSRPSDTWNPIRDTLTNGMGIHNFMDPLLSWVNNLQKCK